MKLSKAEEVEGCKCEVVAKNEIKEIKKKIEKMIPFFCKNNALGLAGPQVGIFKRFFIMKSYRGEKYQIIINPEITKQGIKIGTFREGCLTYPGETIVVKRSKQIKAKWMNEAGEEIAFKLSGKEAQVFQHEYDHLFGITIKNKGEF